MKQSKISRCIRHVLIAGVAIYATGEVWEGRDTLSAGFRRLEDVHAAGLNLGMQLIMLLLILYLCMLAAQHIVELVLILKKPEETQFAEEHTGRLIEIMEKVRIVFSLVPALLIFVLFMAIAIYGMYMASVGRAGSEMYGVGVFFIVVAGWGFISIIRKMIRLLKGKQLTNE